MTTDRSSAGAGNVDSLDLIEILEVDGRLKQHSPDLHLERLPPWKTVVTYDVVQRDESCCESAGFEGTIKTTTSFPTNRGVSRCTERLKLALG